jgi:hypothetical protein
MRYGFDPFKFKKVVVYYLANTNNAPERPQLRINYFFLQFKTRPQLRFTQQ